jgi:hypothetical protein
MRSGVFWLIIAVFVIGRVIKSIKGAAEQQAAAGADEEGFEAAPEEIQEFLRSLTTAAQRRAAGAEGPPAVAVRREPRPVRAARQRAAQAPFWTPPPPVQPKPAARPTAKPQPSRASRKKRVAPRKSPPREVLAARPPAQTAPKPRRGGKAPILALRGTDLKRAVVWSEILGPPVSLRRTRRLPIGRQP